MEIKVEQPDPLVTKRQQGPVRLGLIGCGYVAAMSHLPAARLVQEIELAALVDVRLDLARSLAEHYPAPLVTSDYRDLFDHVDAVVVALPHHLHARVALDFLQRGIHVLVEKPMAPSVAECQQMVQAAQATGAKMAVGLMRRFYDSSRLVKRIIDSGFLGRVLAFEAQEAVLFDNFKASAFSVLPTSGGVLLDTGPHTLDLLLWWLGDFAQLKYWDDARGGVEANCRIEVTTAQGVSGVVELSRTRRFPNVIKIQCEHGCITFPTLAPDQVMVESSFFPGGVDHYRFNSLDEGRQLPFYFARQLENFAGAILRDEPLQVPGEEGLRAIAAIEACKQAQQPLELPSWEKINPEIARRVAE